MGRLLRNRSSLASFLCYHSVAEEGMRYLTVSPALFERQLRHILDRGFRTGGIDALGEAATDRLREPTVFLTFDDGFLDNYTTVLPLLAECGQRAFVFVLPPLVDEGAPLAWPAVAEGQKRHPETMRSVTWAMVEEMAENGIEIGSHTLTHPHLSQLGDEGLRDELLDSRRRVEEHLGSCRVIAFPFGDWSEKVALAAADCGYSYAFTLPSRTGQSRAGALSIPRINVDYRDEPRRLDLKLSPSGKRLLLSPTVASMRSVAGRLRKL